MSHKIHPAVAPLAMLPVMATRAYFPTEPAMKKLLTLALALVTLALIGTELVAQTRTINLNTGYDQWSKAKIDVDQQDNEWRVIFDSINGAPQPPPATGRPADVVSDVGWITKNPSLAVNFPYSRWISITPNQGKPLPWPPPSNKFQYAFYFTLPVGFSSPVLTMKLSADDRITKVTLNDCSFSTGSGGGFNQNPASGVNTSLLSCFNAGPTLNVITVDVEDTGAVITGLIVDGTVTYEDCDRRPIRDIPGLTSITFWESTFAAPTQHKFEKGGPELTAKLSGPLTTGNSDFESLPGIESYDVFYSDWDGTPNPAGQFVTIEANVNGTGAPAGGGLNLARVDFNGTGQFATSVASFVALGNNAMPNDVGKAVDVDPDVLTDTTMGNTIGQTQRLRVTVGFPCPCVPPPSGMVAWWPGDANAIDISDGNNGTLVGGVTYALGKVNQAFSFPSLSSTGSDRVRLTSAPSANTFTIEAWVFANQHGPSAHRTIYADDLRGFWLKNGRLNWWQVDDRFVGDTEVPPGAWHHIALTYSNGTFTGYLDGKADGTSFFPGESLPTGTGLGIGGHSNFVQEDFDGLIDELRVYDRALDPAEIQGIFNVGSAGNCKCAPPPSGMVAWWPLEKLNSDGEYDDLAGGDNNGTPIGNPSQISNQYVSNSLQAGRGNFVAVTDAPNLNFALESFTIDAWVRLTSNSSTDSIVYKLANGGGYFLSIVRTNSTQWKLQLEIGTHVYAGPIFTVTQGTWIFVAAKVDKTSPIAGTVKLYVGVPGSRLAFTNDQAGAFNASSQGTPLLIGRLGDPHASLGIDEVEIFNRALDEPEIEAIFNAGSAGKCKPACPIIRIDPPTLGYQTWPATIDYPPESISATGGTEPHDFTVSSGTLPPGMVVDRYGTLYGKPGMPGTYDFAVTATDANGCAEVREYRVTITCPPITINPVDLPRGEPRTAYNQTITTTGGCAPHTLSVIAGALPPGLTLAADGTLSGTPTREGNFTFTVKATDSCGCSGGRTYVLKISCEPLTYRAGHVDNFGPPNDPALPSAALRAMYPSSIKDFDDPTIDRYVEHTFIGLPHKIVKAELEVRMRPDDELSDNDTISLAFSPIARWGASIKGLPSSQNPRRSWKPGDPARTFIFDLSALPPSGSSPRTNLITDLATEGYLDVVIQDDTTVDYIILRIWTCYCPAITLNPAPGALPAPAINTPYNQTFTATGGCSSPFSYRVTSGALPNGLTLGADGALSGTATQAGTYEFTVTATDSCGCSLSQTYTWTPHVRRGDFPLARGMNEFCVWGGGGGGSYNSPTQIDNPFFGAPVRNTGGVRYGTIGLCYGRILAANDEFAFKYTFNAIPVAVLSYPDVNPNLGFPVPVTATRRNVFGAGLSPIGLQLYFRPQSRIKPFINTSGGFILFKDQVPQLNGSRFNFTYDFGGGVQVFRDSRRAFNFGYKYQRISNGGRALNNPGFDGHVFYFGYSIFKAQDIAHR